MIGFGVDSRLNFQSNAFILYFAFEGSVYLSGDHCVHTHLASLRSGVIWKRSCKEQSSISTNVSYSKNKYKKCERRAILNRKSRREEKT